jgi:hypothetical protein
VTWRKAQIHPTTSTSAFDDSDRSRSFMLNVHLLWPFHHKNAMWHLVVSILKNTGSIGCLVLYTWNITWIERMRTFGIWKNQFRSFCFLYWKRFLSEFKSPFFWRETRTFGLEYGMRFYMQKLFPSRLLDTNNDDSLANWIKSHYSNWTFFRRQANEINLLQRVWFEASSHSLFFLFGLWNRINWSITIPFLI